MGCLRSRRKCKISFSSGEWKPLITTLSVWQMDSAHWRASWASCGVALREAKNATSGLSKSSVFPDKSIKKAQALHLLIQYLGLGCPFENKQHKRPRRKYIAHTEPIGDGDIHQMRTSCCRSPCKLKPPSFEFRRIVKKYPIKYVWLNGKSHKPLQRYRKFLRKREFVKNSCVGICYLCTISPDFGCNSIGL